MSTEVQPQIKKIHTSCQDCCLTVYNEENTTQVGCLHNLIEYYKNIGNEVLEAYNENGEFYIINGRKCFFKRTVDWYLGYGFKDKNECLEKIVDDTKIKYMAVININKENDLKDIEYTIQSLLSQSPQPSFIICVRSFDCPIKPSDINSLLIKTKKMWRVSNPSCSDITYEDVFNGLIDIFWKDYPIYLKIKAGNLIHDNNLMVNINSQIIYDDYKLDAEEYLEPYLIVGNSFLYNYERQQLQKLEESKNE